MLITKHQCRHGASREALKALMADGGPPSARFSPRGSPSDNWFGPTVIMNFDEMPEKKNRWPVCHHRGFNDKREMIILTRRDGEDAVIWIFIGRRSVMTLCCLVFGGRTESLLSPLIPPSLLLPEQWENSSEEILDCPNKWCNPFPVSLNVLKWRREEWHH